MALVSPLKKDVEKAAKDIDNLNRLYNIYFSGAEDDPPANERKALDSLIAQIKAQVAKPSNSADKFQANSVVSRFQVICGKWDKTLRAIESGTIVRPKKRR